MPICSYCQADSDEPCVPTKEEIAEADKTAFEQEVERLQQMNEELEEWYDAATNYHAEKVVEEDPVVGGPHDLTGEETRIYHFLRSDGVGYTITVDDPDDLAVTKSDRHLINAEGYQVGLSIPTGDGSGFTHYEIKPREGFDPFEVVDDEE